MADNNESFVQLPADGDGKAVDGFLVDPGEGADPQFRQTVVVGDPADAKRVANVKAPGESADGSEYGLVVHVSPDTPLKLDPTVPAIIGGIGPDGATRRARVGMDGGLQPTDAVSPGTYVGNAIGNLCILDTTGYNSISLQLVASSNWTGTFQFSISNDGQTWVNQLGSSISNPGSYNVQASTSNIFLFAVSARWFRVSIVAYTAGQTVAIPYLRSNPSPPIAMNIGAINSVPISTLGAGVGNSSLPVGGSDVSSALRTLRTDPLGNQVAAGGLTQGYQIGAYNVTYTPYTTAISTLTTFNAVQSALSPVVVGGTDQTNAVRRMLTDNLGNVQVTSAPANQAQQSIQDLLAQIVGLLRVNNHYLYEIRSAAAGVTGDEPDSLLGDYTNPAASLVNMIN
jgi:hypothetical protein